MGFERKEEYSRIFFFFSLFSVLLYIYIYVCVYKKIKWILKKAKIINYHVYIILLTKHVNLLLKGKHIDNN